MSADRLSREVRGRLRTMLLAEYPWLGRTDVGPRSVDAGECASCGQRPNLVPTCGPGSAVAALCADCAVASGPGAWCDGHRDDAEEALTWASGLPPEWPAVTRLWWVATGEVGFDDSLLAAPRVAALVSRAADRG